MSYDPHVHVSDFIVRRSKIKPGDLWAELEEGCCATSFDIPIKLEDEFGELLGYSQVLATIQSKASLMEPFPIPIEELLYRAGVPIEDLDKRPDYKISLLNELKRRYPEKKSVEWFTFYILEPPQKIEQNVKFKMHFHYKGPMIVLAEDILRLKDKSIKLGAALADGYRIFNFDADTKIKNVVSQQIGKGRVVGVIQTKFRYLDRLKPLIGLSDMIFDATQQPVTLVRRQLMTLYNKKSDSGWFSLAYFLLTETSLSGTIEEEEEED